MVRRFLSYFLLLIYTLNLDILTHSLAETATDNSTLKLLFIVYRHGDRAPISLYGTDPNPPSSWPQGLGRLTNLGKKQQYELGQYLRERYKYYLGNDPRELYVRSSGKERCLESAQCNIASLYLPKGLWVWNADLKWQPIPIFTVPLSEDAVLYDEAICPEADKELERIRNSPEGKKFIHDHKELFEYVRKNSGDTVESWDEMAYVSNTIRIEQEYGLIIPNWTEPVWSDMQRVENFRFYIDASTQLIQRLRGGPLIGEIISIMENKVKNKTPEEQKKYKAYMYSTHDTVLISLLSALNVFDRLPVPYTTTILVELHENDPHNHVVRLFYRNSSRHDPYPLTLPGCETDCPLGHFIRLTEDVIPLEWKSECGLKDLSGPFSLVALIVIGMMGIVVALLMISTAVMLCLRCHKEKTGIRYHRVPEGTA